MTITTRTGKGSALTHPEMDANLNTFNNWTSGPATKTAAKALTPEDGVKIYPQGSDGGPFIGGTGKAAGYYNDDGGTAYGTRFKPTGGDGSAGWERADLIEVTPIMFGAVKGGVVDDYTGLNNAYNAAVALSLPYNLTTGVFATGTGLSWTDTKVSIYGAGKYSTQIKRLPAIASGTPTLTISGKEHIIRNFGIDNDDQAGDGMYITSCNNSTFTSIYVNNVVSGYAWTLDSASSTNYYDCFARDVDKILYVNSVSNQVDFYDFGGIATSKTEAAIKLENSFRLNFFGGICEHDGRGIEIGPYIDGVLFQGYYCESLTTSAALSDILIGANGSVTPQSHTVAFRDCYFTQNMDKGAPNIEITDEVENVIISGGRLSRSSAGTDDLIKFSGAGEYVTIENMDTFTISACNVINATGVSPVALNISNITYINAASSINVGSPNGCSIKNIKMPLITEAGGTRLSAEGVISNNVTDGSGVLRYLAGNGFNRFGGGVFDLLERSATGAHPGAGVYLHARDNAGKTELVAVFPTGAIQVVAAEP